MYDKTDSGHSYIVMLSVPAELYPAFVYSPIELDSLRCTCVALSALKDSFVYKLDGTVVSKTQFLGAPAGKAQFRKIIGHLHSYTRTEYFESVTLACNDHQIVAVMHGADDFITMGGLKYQLNDKSNSAEFRRRMWLFGVRVLERFHLNCAPKWRFPWQKRTAAAVYNWLDRGMSHNGVTITMDDFDIYTVEYEGVKYKYEPVVGPRTMKVGRYYYDGPIGQVHMLAGLLNDVYVYA